MVSILVPNNADSRTFPSHRIGMHILVCYPRVSRHRAFRPETESVRWRNDPKGLAADLLRAVRLNVSVATFWQWADAAWTGQDNWARYAPGVNETLGVVLVGTLGSPMRGPRLSSSDDSKSLEHEPSGSEEDEESSDEEDGAFTRRAAPLPVPRAASPAS